jgi:hypothetical protein
VCRCKWNAGHEFFFAAGGDPRTSAAMVGAGQARLSHFPWRKKLISALVYPIHAPGSILATARGAIPTSKRRERSRVIFPTQLTIR